MVYNAMKLFMEINPQLFDDCSHEYTEQQNSAASREALRQNKWAAIQEQADRRKALNGTATTPGQGQGQGPPARNHPSPLPRLDEVDPMTEDNQKRLDSLKLQDGDRRDRRPTIHERQNSVGSNRSQR
jgi:serine/threonine-protein phosphatase 2A regulatory subunit B'